MSREPPLARRRLGAAGVVAVSDRGEVDWTARAGEDRREGAEAEGRKSGEPYLQRGVRWAGTPGSRQSSEI